MTQPDKLFREKLEAYESAAPLAAWDKIESNLDKTRYKGLWMKIAAGIALLAIGLFAWYTTTNNSHQHESQIAKSDEPVVVTDNQKIIEAESTNTPSDETSVKTKESTHTKEATRSSNFQAKKSVQPGLVAQAETPTEISKPIVTVEPLEINTNLVAELNNQTTASAEQTYSSNVIIYTAEEVNQKYLKKNSVDATSEEKKPSGIQRLITLAADLKNTEGGMRELRDKKNEILALNFRKNNEAKIN